MQPLRRLALLLLVIGITGCDHATKLWAASGLPNGHRVDLITGVLSLQQARNTDTAFSMLASIVPTEPRLLLLKATATLGALAILILALLRRGGSNWHERLGFACLLGGAAGNAIDRWRWGYVIDFIRLEYWPTFNVADMALCLGGGFLVAAAWHTAKHRASASFNPEITGRGPL